MGAAATKIERWQEVHAELIDIGVQRGGERPVDRAGITVLMTAA